MTTHTSYKVSKALKEFLGKSAPEPMMSYPDDDYGYPRYMLHDLLSKPFCEAMAQRIDPVAKGYIHPGAIYASVHMAYWDGGLPAVEAELMRMMGKEDK